jgi:5-methylcytosine-specific restriction protein A
LRRWVLKSISNFVLSYKACDFEFSKKYGELGKGYIEIHHTEPIHTIDENGIKQKLPDALKKVVPLCSNCHRMVHRNREKLLNIEELKKILQ